MLISSPPRAPCSAVHSSPVAGLRAAPCTLRWPIDQISGGPAGLPRIVVGSAAVGLMRTILPRWFCRVLRLVAQVEALAERDEERARAVEDEPRAPMVRAGVGRLLPEDHLHVLERPAGGVDLRARDRGAGAAVAAILGKAQVDHAIAGEIRVEKHVEQAALPARENLRQAGEGLRELALGRHHPQPPRPLRHEHAPVRQEGEPPGVLEPARDRLDDEVRLLGLHLQRLLRERRRREQQEGERRSRTAHKGPPRIDPR